MNSVNDGGYCCSCDPCGSKGLAGPGTVAECNCAWDSDYRLHLSFLFIFGSLEGEEELSSVLTNIIEYYVINSRRFES